MYIRIPTSLSLYIFEHLHCKNVIGRFHGPYESCLNGRKLLLHQAIDINDLPGIFPLAEPRNLGDERPSWIYTATSQELHPSLRWEVRILFTERIDWWRD